MRMFRGEKKERWADEYCEDRELKPNWYALLISIVKGITSAKALELMGLAENSVPVRTDKVWTPALEEYVINMRESGMYFTEIAATVGLKSDYVRTRYHAAMIRRGRSAVDLRTQKGLGIERRKEAGLPVSAKV